MAFWSRLRQSKLKFNLFPSVYNRCYTINHSTIVANQHIRSHPIIRVLDNLDFIVQGRPSEFSNVRFYAKKSYKGNFQKKEESEPSKPRMNDEITEPTVRLVTDEGGHFVISRHEALVRAKNLKLDLVEVDNQSKVPVCKIFDYKKQKYVQRTREKERAKSKEFLKTGSCKEIRFAAKINQKDLKMKADLAKRLMENCHRVKCTAIDPTDQCDLPTLLSRFRALIKDFAIEESAPKVETKQAFVVVRHVKFGAAKSGGKKASKSNSQQSKENGSETEPVDAEEEHSDEDDGTKESEWSVQDGDGGDDINTAFDINEENYGQQLKSQQPAAVTAPPMGNRYARNPTAGNPSRIPNQTRPNRPYENSHGTNIPSSPSKNFRNIFGGNQANTAPSNQNAPAGNNRYKKNGPPSDSVRNPTATDPRMKRGPGGDTFKVKSCASSLFRGLTAMDFDEYEYLENTVENPEPKKSNNKSNGGDETAEHEDKDRSRSSKHRGDDGGDDVDRSSKRSSSRKESNDHEKDRRSRNGLSSRDREKGDKDRHTSSREHRVRDKERNRDGDRDRDRDSDRKRDGNRERRGERDYGERNRDEERDGSKRSRNQLESHDDERVRDKSSNVESMDKDVKEGRRERGFRGRDHDNRIWLFLWLSYRRYKEKKEDGAEQQADPERDQRTVFAYQISLKAGERDVYEFFSRVGKVRDVQLIMDRNTRRSKGVGYIEFYESMSVPMAIALTGQLLLGQPVMVKPSEAEKNLVQPTVVTGGGLGPYSGGARRLYVGNLPLTIKEDQLRQVFEAFGAIELVQMPTDPGTLNCKGYAFIQFARLEDAKAAQSLNGKLEIAGQFIKVSAVTDQAGMQDAGVNLADFDDDEGSGLPLNAHSRALLMQKLDRTGTASSINVASAVPILGQTPIPVLPGLTAGGLSMPALAAPPIDTVGVPSECLLLKNMFDPNDEADSDFDLDIKDDCEKECIKYGKLKHIYVDKNSAGFVYMRFENATSAMDAQRTLHGRWFAGKMITATFMVPQDYEAKFPDSS
ncbi:RNA-binding protein 39 [Phtheirospermum japonicum]|uniref:RNA-binding protein 39 n=1 Tax=Phtheirospermum japonicum TaxID=374723 RepID=A0A830BST3_9LAMI|nr:RNA-binding protein 39 [Phtheirospermum japonicum]